MADIISGVGDLGDNSFGDSLTKEQVKKAVEQFDVPGRPDPIGIDESFEFECQQCGACCINRNDIILNAFDIYKASKFLGIEPSEFIKQYTNRFLGGYSKIPILTLKAEEKSGFCPFLTLDYAGCGAFKCSINPAKPGACYSHPIGLMSSSEMGEDGELQSLKTSFIKVAQCEQSKTGKMQVVREWMKDYIDHEQEVLKAHEISIVTNSILNWRKFFLMSSVFTVASNRCGNVKGGDMMTQAFNIVATILTEYAYANFDISKDFCVQCDENIQFLKTQFKEFSETLIPAMEEVFKETCKVTPEEALERAEKEDIDKTILHLGVNCTYGGVSMDDDKDKEESDGDPS